MILITEVYLLKNIVHFAYHVGATVDFAIFTRNREEQ